MTCLVHFIFADLLNIVPYLSSMKYSCVSASLNIDEGLVTNIFLLFKLFPTSVQNPLLWALPKPL